ncbi:MAG: hypothetical protein MR902_05725 [Campylobacter sp.]|nr:hypothetical protein [Campylobacter sp.]
MLNTYETGANDYQFLGNFNTDTPNTIYINLAYIDNPVKLTKALGHELYHLISFYKNSFILNDMNQNRLANHQGYLLTYYLNESLKEIRPLYKYEAVKIDSNDEKLSYNDYFFNELDKYSSDNAVPVVASLGARILHATFKSSFAKKIPKEAADKLTKIVIQRCIHCHNFEGKYKTGPSLDYDLSEALKKDKHHSKFMKSIFRQAGIKFNDSDLIGYEGSVNVGPITIEGDGGKESSYQISSPGNMQKQIEKGKAPKSVDRVDKGRSHLKKIIYILKMEVL